MKFGINYIYVSHGRKMLVRVWSNLRLFSFFLSNKCSLHQFYALKIYVLRVMNQPLWTNNAIQCKVEIYVISAIIKETNNYYFEMQFGIDHIYVPHEMIKSQTTLERQFWIVICLSKCCPFIIVLSLYVFSEMTKININLNVGFLFY